MELQGALGGGGGSGFSVEDVAYGLGSPGIKFGACDPMG